MVSFPVTIKKKLEKEYYKINYFLNIYKMLKKCLLRINEKIHGIGEFEPTLP